MGFELVRSDEAAETAVAVWTEQAREYIDQAKAKNTRRAYRADWADFAAWCEVTSRVALPATAETGALYLTARAERCKTSTLQRRLTSISQAHQAAGHASPTKDSLVRTVWAGVRRAKGVAQEGKAPAITREIRAMVETLDDSLGGRRDRALLLLGFAGAFRRSELVALDVTDAVFTEDGIVVHLRRSKTDAEGAGRKVGIPYGSHPATCPVRVLKAWLAASGIGAGALFRGVNRHGRLLPGRLSDKGVARVVKRCAEAAGFDPAQYAGHSLRAGLATSAAAAGVSERVIAQQTGHQSMVVLRRSIREGSLFRENAAAAVGL
jgi:site-specific recombinase XerD